MQSRTQVKHLRLQWYKCPSNNRRTSCGLVNVSLADKAFDGGGNYIIWCGGDAKTKKPAQTVYTGQATVFRDRLTEHRSDQRILSYVSRGLFVEWAEVPSAQRDGVECYLNRELKPLVGTRCPDVPPISVNLPWGESNGY